MKYAITDAAATRIADRIIEYLQEIPVGICSYSKIVQFIGEEGFANPERDYQHMILKFEQLGFAHLATALGQAAARQLREANEVISSLQDARKCLADYEG